MCTAMQHCTTRDGSCQCAHRPLILPVVHSRGSFAAQHSICAAPVHFVLVVPAVKTCLGDDFSIGKDDLRKLLRMYRESQTTGDFARIYPPVADRPMDRRIQDELQRLAAHMHGMVRNATDPSAVTPTTTFSMQPIVDKLAAVASLGAAVGASE
eukprot:m.542471 g.542471  ORF g.542471 m.542471 type:complete len:154 (+) comp22119_c0_seq9:105-566(+)